VATADENITTQALRNAEYQYMAVNPDTYRNQVSTRCEKF